MRASPFSGLFITALACSLFAVPAQAQRDRVFVASYGSDANPCTFGSPCKTFQNAYNVVAVGGEVTAIDSAGFGPITINHSVTITSPDGVEAGIATVGDYAIKVQAGASDVVALRGLTLDGAGVGLGGIEFNSGQSLTVENCVVRNMGAIGLVVLANGTTTQELTVSNSYFTGNGSDGISIQTESSGAVTAAIDRTLFYNNGGNGLDVAGNGGSAALTVAVTDSVAANNGGAGFSVSSQAGGSVTNLSLTHSQSEGNADGVAAIGTPATLWLTQSTLAGNTSVFLIQVSGNIKSYGDNFLNDNGPSSGGSLGTATSQ
jgi:hypothetical protein